MTRVCDGSLLPRADRDAVYLLRTFGTAAHEIWNVTIPESPNLIKRLPGLRDTHKSWRECETGTAYLVSGVPGWRARRMTEVYDLTFIVGRRTRELGLRLALGGSQGSIIVAVVRQIVLILGLGAVAGVAGSLVVIRAVITTIVESAHSGANLPIALAAWLLIGVSAVLAALVPALRGARLDLSAAQHCE